MLQLKLSPVSESVMDTRSAPAPSGDAAGKSSFADVIKDQGKADDHTPAQGKLSGAEAKGKTAATQGGKATNSQDETAQVTDAEPLAVKQSESKKRKADSAKQNDEEVDFLQHLQDSLSADTAIRATPVPPIAIEAGKSDAPQTDPEADALEAANSTSGGKKLPSSLEQCLVPQHGQERDQGEAAECSAMTAGAAPKAIAQSGELASGVAQSAQGSEESQEQTGQQAASSRENGKSAKADLQSQLDSATSSPAANPVDKGALASFFPLNHGGEAEKALSPVATAPDAAQTAAVTSLAKSGSSGKAGSKEALSLPVSVDKEGTTTTSDKVGEGSLSSALVSKGDAMASSSAPENMVGVMASHAAVSRTASAEQGMAAASDNSHLSSRAADAYKELASVDLGNSSHGAQQLAERVSLMIGQKWHEAELELEPLGLGKIQIQLSVGQDQQASVQFVVQQQHSREAVEQTLPRLKEMLAQQGILLTQSSVQQQSQQQGQSHSGQQGLANSGEQGQHGGGRGSQDGENGAETTASVQNLLI
ncbi:MAG: flagellar hook-length control protein FliK, partial [Aeromonadaceae bacterium]|nr:flagellar hook-length control protein FliK [Aeromonadaceae bacterium]